MSSNANIQTMPLDIYKTIADYVDDCSKKESDKKQKVESIYTLLCAKEFFKDTCQLSDIKREMADTIKDLGINPIKTSMDLKVKSAVISFIVTIRGPFPDYSLRIWFDTCKYSLTRDSSVLKTLLSLESNKGQRTKYCNEILKQLFNGSKEELKLESYVQSLDILLDNGADLSAIDWNSLMRGKLLSDNVNGNILLLLKRAMSLHSKEQRSEEVFFALNLLNNQLEVCLRDCKYNCDESRSSTALEGLKVITRFLEVMIQNCAEVSKMTNNNGQKLQDYISTIFLQSKSASLSWKAEPKIKEAEADLLTAIEQRDLEDERIQGNALLDSWVNKDNL